MARKKCPKRRCPSAVSPLLAGIALGAAIIYLGAMAIPVVSGAISIAPGTNTSPVTFYQ